MITSFIIRYKEAIKKTSVRPSLATSVSKQFGGHGWNRPQKVIRVIARQLIAGDERGSPYPRPLTSMNRFGGVGRFSTTTFSFENAVQTPSFAPRQTLMPEFDQSPFYINFDCLPWSSTVGQIATKRDQSLRERLVPSRIHSAACPSNICRER